MLYVLVTLPCVLATMVGGVGNHPALLAAGLAFAWAGIAYLLPKLTTKMRSWHQRT